MLWGKQRHRYCFQHPERHTALLLLVGAFRWHSSHCIRIAARHLHSHGDRLEHPTGNGVYDCRRTCSGSLRHSVSGESGWRRQQRQRDRRAYRRHPWLHVFLGTIWRHSGYSHRSPRWPILGNNHRRQQLPNDTELHAYCFSPLGAVGHRPCQWNLHRWADPAVQCHLQRPRHGHSWGPALHPLDDWCDLQASELRQRQQHFYADLYIHRAARRC